MVLSSLLWECEEPTGAHSRDPLAPNDGVTLIYLEAMFALP